MRVGAALAAATVLGATRPGLADASAPPPPPAFAAEKPVMLDLADKKEGSFPTAIPLFGYDPNTGVGLGAGAFYFVNGARSDPLFAVTPYRHRVFLQGYVTTGGYQQHVLSYHGVYLGGTPLRLRAQLEYEKNTEANYFGIGEATLGPPSFRGRSYPTYAAELAAASALRPGGVASPQYDHYESERPSAQVALERDFLGGLVRVQYGFVFQHTSITPYDGRRIDVTADGQGATAVEGPTRLGADCERGAALGCGGGFDDRIKAGIAFDTRDFEPDPNRGVFADATAEWSTKALGSGFDYVRVTLAVRGYWSPFPKLADLVLAARGVYSIESDGVPFFAMDTLAMTEGDQAGLGGENTLRGFRQDRFVGRVAALANVELRWTFYRFHLLKQLFSLQVAPFADAGRVFDRPGFAFDHWQIAGGAGAHLGWNQSTIVRFDLAFSREDAGFYIDFGMPF